MISVIMPVYNVARCKHKFLSAVYSVLNQTWSQLELILVNDGSVDSSSQLLNNLGHKHQRIKVIEKDNGGVESARRAGLKEAKGNYILHIDQDDVYRKDAFEIMRKKMEQNQADVVVANSQRFIFFKKFTLKTLVSPTMSQERLITHDEFMNSYYRSFFGINDFPVSIWNKMYRKSFIDSVPEPPLTGHIIEDLSYNMHILPYSKCISLIPDVLYYYRWGGYTNGYDKTILATALTGYSLKKQQISKWQLPNTFFISSSIELLNYLNTYFSNIVIFESVDKNMFVKECERVFALSDVVEAVNAVRENGRYHKEHIDAMLASDFERLYHYEMIMRKKQAKRIFAKKIMLRFQ